MTPRDSRKPAKVINEMVELWASNQSLRRLVIGLLLCVALALTFVLQIKGA